LWVTIRASIQGESSPDEAKKYVREVVTRLDKVLAELSRREYEQRRDQLKQAVEQAQESAQLARQRLDEVKTKLESVSAPVSETVLEGLVSDLKKQQQALELELAGIRGRTEALQKELAKMAERTKKEPAADEVLQNLRRVVELRRAQLAATRQLHEQGTVTSLEVGKAEEQVALAQIELAQAQRAVEKPNAEQMDKLTGELAQLAINRAENEAKLKFVTNRLDETLSALKHEVQSKPLRQQLEKQLNAVANLQAQADQAAADLRTFEASFRPAHVEVLDLTPREPKDGEKSPQSK
jgi:chromosome segregation ATPase